MATPPDSPIEDVMFEIEPSRVPKHRPVALEDLCRQTKFTRQEIRVMYRGFKQECPEGVVHEDSFKDIYAKFFPHGRPAGDAVDAAARLHVREAALDLQAVRHQRRRLHHARRALRDRGRHPRADGPARAPRQQGGGREEGARAGGQGLQEAGPQPGRRHHHRGVHRVLSQGRGDHQVAAGAGRRQRPMMAGPGGGRRRRRMRGRRRAAVPVAGARARVAPRARRLRGVPALALGRPLRARRRLATPADADADAATTPPPPPAPHAAARPFVSLHASAGRHLMTNGQDYSSDDTERVQTFLLLLRALAAIKCL